MILRADSLNAHYRPEVLVAAIRVLNAIGLRVGVARERFCCGRPFHDLGMLEQARQRLQRILDGFAGLLPDGAAVAVLESSCRSMFRDDLLRLLPDDARASELAARVTGLAELLERHGVRPVRCLRRGVLHLHCVTTSPRAMHWPSVRCCRPASNRWTSRNRAAAAWRAATG